MTQTRRTLLKTIAAGALAAPMVARAATPKSINIAFFNATQPVMIAKGEGWFQQAMGAPINWVEVGSGAEINTAIAAGSVDIGMAIGSSPTAAGLSQGIPYKLIGMVDNIGAAEEMTVRKSADIKTAADFKGKKIATPFGSTSHFRLMGFLHDNGLTQSEVTVLDMRPDAIVAAWKRGDIDAAYVWSPAKSTILADGGVLFDTYKRLDDIGYIIADLIVARTAFLDAYPDTVVAMLKAYGRARDLWQSDPAAAAKIVGQQVGIEPDVARVDMAQYEFVSLKAQLSPEWLGPPGHPGKFAAVLKRTADFLVEQKSIRSAGSLAVYQKGIDTGPLEKAAG